MESPVSLPTERLINELQTFGVRLADPKAGRREPPRRRGALRPQGADDRRRDGDGAGPHRARVRQPLRDRRARCETAGAASRATARRSAKRRSPRGRASTTSRPPTACPIRRSPCCTDATCWRRPCCRRCIRYQSRAKACQFCAIGQSLAAGRTIERKTPAQLAEVAKAAVALDGVKHMVMTTGTPRGADRGAAILCESAAAVKAAVDLPDPGAMRAARRRRMVRASARPPASTALGMHLEAVTPEVRQRIMPGKAEVSVERYLAAFAAAVPVFGRGQVSTYILAGLGDTREAILAMCETLVASASIRSSCRSCRSPARRSKAGRRPRPPSCMRCSRRSRGCSPRTA